MEIIPAVLSIILITGVFLSLIRNDYWIYKIWEYPRLQKLTLVIIVIASWVIFWPPDNLFYRVVFWTLVASLFYLLYKIWPYTVFFKKEMLKAIPDAENEIKIFAANVLQDNKEYQNMLDQVKESDPDLVYLVETNNDWADAMKELEKDYPFKLLMPLENTYGLVFYSRMPLEDAHVKFLVKADIPSIEATVTMRSGQKVKVWGVHPEPTVPGENLYSTAKDKELMKIALKAKEEKLPCMVFGDLNDVAWSHTTELFRKVSGLLDPRRGRGFYSTFSAHHWFVRYPLDYIFCSDHFGLIEMKRMPKNGSDHFATITHLVLCKEAREKQEAPRADQKELDEAKEKSAETVKE